MSVQKVIKISNIGRLTNLAAQGAVDFKRVTVIYGLNGNGKTTLASVLRSLQSGNAAHIMERATLGVSAGPVAELLVAEGTARFDKGKWQLTKPNLEIFDSEFVNENVYTGDTIDQEHRRNLYQVVVGESAVKLARRVDELDAESRSVATEIRNAEEGLRKHVQAPFGLEDFIQLKNEPDLDKKISDLTSRLNAVRKQEEVLARQQLEKLAAPALSTSVISVLQTATTKMADAASKKVQAHFLSRLGEGGEHWVRQGVSFLKDKSCPFCTQDVTKVDLVNLFQEYFSQSYKEHVVAIQQAINEVQHSYSDEVLSRLTRRELENEARIASWADLASLKAATFATDRIESGWRSMRQILLDRLRRKLAQPGYVMEDDAEVEAARRDYGEALKSLEDHNQRIDEANQKISQLKKQAASTEAPQLEAELRRLRNIQIRQQPDVAKLCVDLLAHRKRKKEFEDEKKKVRTSLEQQASSVLSKYEGEINRLLRQFGATFEITGTKPSFAGGKASSTYQITINKTPVDLGDSRTPKGTPSFRTVLSSGDKSTLALAFFMARLNQDSALASKVVVFDDPLSSLDAFRISCTQQEVCKIASKAQQVIVLSHDANFLMGICDSTAADEMRTLQFVRDSGTHTIKPWDVQDHVLKSTHRDYLLLRDFLSAGVPKGGDLIGVARSVRPYLEGHLRYRYPDEYGTHETLGSFVDRISTAPASSPVAGLKPKEQEWKDLNEYARRFHHSGVDVTPATTTDDELRAYAKRALALVQGGLKVPLVDP